MVAGVVTILERFAHCSLRTTIRRAISPTRLPQWRVTARAFHFLRREQLIDPMARFLVPDIEDTVPMRVGTPSLRKLNRRHLPRTNSAPPEPSVVLLSGSFH
jgi:hypothetical protein